MLRNFVATKGRALFAACAVLWMSALVAVPVIAARQPVTRPAVFMTAAMYGVGAVICHQRPERSFFVSGVQMPVCARCAGLYAGAALAAVAVAMRGRRRAPDRDVLRLALCVAAVPTAATLVYEWSTGVMPANALRALLAVPLGGVIAWIVTRVSTATTAVEVH